MPCQLQVRLPGVSIIRALIGLIIGAIVGAIVDHAAAGGA
jgi:hypothetical protein